MARGEGMSIPVKHAEPLDMREANDRLVVVRREASMIRRQLETRQGEPTDTAYSVWRRRAVLALRHYEDEARELKAWMKDYRERAAAATLRGFVKRNGLDADDPVSLLANACRLLNVIGGSGYIFEPEQKNIIASIEDFLRRRKVFG